MDAKIKNMVEENILALGTTNEDGTPNVIPVGCAKIISKDELIITDNFMIKTRRNIIRNGNVCLTVWDKSEKGYKILGEAKYFESGKWKEYVKKLSENKGLPAKGAIFVKIKEIKSLAN